MSECWGAAEIRIRAERRLGELLSQTPKAKGGQPYQRRSTASGTAAVKSLADVGISDKLSSRAQELAAVPESVFEEKLVGWRERIEEENERATIREGDTTLLKDVTVYIEEITKSSGFRAWHGTLQLSPDQHIELGGPYRIELDDGRSGAVFITISSPALTAVPFRGTGPLS